MWLMLQHAEPDDYVVATGEQRSVQQFIDPAFSVVDLPWKKYVKHDRAFERPSESHRLIGSNEKIRRTLGWKPRTSFQDLVREMVEAELAALADGAV
jgi:GDPmannose 4,6-dehydratase